MISNDMTVVVFFQEKAHYEDIDEISQFVENILESAAFEVGEEIGK